MSYDGAIHTEADWLASSNPDEMVRILPREDEARRLWQLFACACCWRILSLLDDRSRHAVAIAERQAEGLATHEEIEDARHIAHAAVVTIWQPEVDPAFAHAAMAAHYAIIGPERAYHHAALAAGSGKAAEHNAQAGLLRDLFGNPFQTVRIDPAWRSPTVLAIAGDVYDNDTFSDLPILADALEDAGCEDPRVLDHARHCRPHVRGCWLVDILLQSRLNPRSTA